MITVTPTARRPGRNDPRFEVRSWVHLTTQAQAKRQAATVVLTPGCLKAVEDHRHR